MNSSITCSELEQLVSKGAVVIDVMTPEDYAAGHLAGAQNACIYEMAFPERIAACAPDKSRALIVYDATGTTLAAGTARERLLAAGYDEVYILAGGLAAWCAAGLPVETTAEADPREATPADGSYRIDTDNSRLEWIGRSLTSRHYGRIDIGSGELLFSAGRLVEGNIVLAMTTISDFDLQDSFWRELLLRHLKSEEFFAVERFPTASFRLSGWQAAAGASSEAPNGILSGELTIRDVTRPVSFPAIVAPQPDGSIKAHAAFDIDRTLWNVTYGSSRLFERLGMHLVHDLISLELFIVARP